MLAALALAVDDRETFDRTLQWLRAGAEADPGSTWFDDQARHLRLLSAVRRR